MSNKKAIKFYEEGRVLQQERKLADAERAYKKAIKFNRTFVEAHNNLGNVFLDQGRHKEACDAFREAQILLPEHPMKLHNLGHTFQLQGKYIKAIDWYNKAIIQDPNFVISHINLGNALRRSGRLGEAVTSYRKAIEVDSGFSEAYYNLGSILIEFGELEAAVSNFNKVIQIDPGHKYANKRLGNVLSDLGELDKAITSYHKAIEINPEHAEVFRLLSKIKKFSKHDDDIDAMESLYTKASVSDEQKMHLAFGLGKAYEDLGEYEKSMAYIMEANRLNRASLDYSNSETEELFSNIKATFSIKFFSDRKGMGIPDQTPIFILGMPRSGTSLVEQILASHPDVFGAGELEDLPIMIKRISTRGSMWEYPECIDYLERDALADLGEKYIARIRQYSEDTKYITDKMPNNFLRIGLIKAILPNAKIINCTRNPMDNCLSIFKNYFAVAHTYSYDMTELGQYYKLYLDLMAYWNNTFPGFIYDLSYETLVADQQNQTRQLLDYCRLPWNDACLYFHKTRRKVGTISNAQVRHPIYNNSVELWKRYENQLEPLRTEIYG